MVPSAFPVPPILISAAAWAAPAATRSAAATKSVADAARKRLDSGTARGEEGMATFRAVAAGFRRLGPVIGCPRRKLEALLGLDPRFPHHLHPAHVLFAD